MTRDTYQFLTKIEGRNRMKLSCMISKCSKVLDYKLKLDAK